MIMFSDIYSLFTLLSLCCITGGTARIQRANADEFIHIFVNNSKKLTEFLEHMLKVLHNFYLMYILNLQCTLQFNYCFVASYYYPCPLG